MAETDKLEDRLRWQLDREVGLRMQMVGRMERAERECSEWKDAAIRQARDTEKTERDGKDYVERLKALLREGRLIYHCTGCGAFVCEPAGDKCSCGCELHPIQFRAEPGVRFWFSIKAESRFTATPPVGNRAEQITPGHGDDVEPAW